MTPALRTWMGGAVLALLAGSTSTPETVVPAMPPAVAPATVPATAP